MPHDLVVESSKPETQTGTESLRHILVVDDNSPDGTGQIADELGVDALALLSEEYEALKGSLQALPQAFINSSLQMKQFMGLLSSLPVTLRGQFTNLRTDISLTSDKQLAHEVEGRPIQFPARRGLTPIHLGHLLGELLERGIIGREGHVLADRRLHHAGEVHQ